jgi:hypothetical protein
MEYLKGTKIIVLKYSEVVPLLFSADNFRQKRSRSERKGYGIKVHGRNGGEQECMVEFGSLDRKDKDKVIEQYGDPRAYIATQPLKDMLKMDVEAQHFYATYTYKNGQTVDLEKQVKWIRSVQWLNVIVKVMANKKSAKEIWGVTITELWDNIAFVVKNDEVEHDLPGYVNRLKGVYREYLADGYKALVDEWRYGNDYARKVTPKIEGLIMSLYVRQGHNAYMNEVCRQYRDFMHGKEIIVHLETGEVFDPKEFHVNGKPYVLGESTVDYYLKKPGNEDIINSYRMNKLLFNSTHRPSVQRLAPMYALSKITMDDLDIPFKTPDGDRAVKSYQVFDVCSGAVIGVSFSRDKNVELIREALRDMFRLIVRNGWGVPWEIEFEKHLTSAMTGGVDQDGVIYDDILTPGAVFPATRMCIGGNAKEKRAEGFIRVKKYGQQKKRPGFQARFYARLLTNRLNAEQDKARYSYEEIVDNELADIAAHNAELHPKQDLYPGLTRWQVLEQNQNPQLVKYQAHQVIQFIGYQTTTSIRAGVARVQYGNFQLPDINLVKQQHYNGEIVAYYLPDDAGLVNEVHLFEDGRYLCCAQRKAGFQEAIVEQTADDIAIAQQQWGQQSAFDKMIRDGRDQLVKVGTTKAQIGEPVKRKGVVKQIAAPAEPEYLPAVSPGDARSRALADI